MNDYQSVNLTASTVYRSLWVIHGQLQDSDCLQQVDLIDVSPALDGQRDPNRTQWAQTALLWTLTQTRDSTPITQLQDFIKNADWAKLESSDGPVTSAASTFTTSAAGFSYDFAAQTIVPLPATFVKEGQPQGEQKSRVDNDTLPSLNRMYGYAVGEYSYLYYPHPPLTPLATSVFKATRDGAFTILDRNIIATRGATRII